VAGYREEFDEAMQEPKLAQARVRERPGLFCKPYLHKIWRLFMDLRTSFPGTSAHLSTEEKET
jgi:hypothetical protein